MYIIEPHTNTMFKQAPMKPVVTNSSKQSGTHCKASHFRPLWKECVSYDVVMSCRVVPCHAMSCHVTSRQVASRRVASRRVASRRVASRRVVSRRVATTAAHHRARWRGVAERRPRAAQSRSGYPSRGVLSGGRHVSPGIGSLRGPVGASKCCRQALPGSSGKPADFRLPSSKKTLLQGSGMSFQTLAVVVRSNSRRTIIEQNAAT